MIHLLMDIVNIPIILMKGFSPLGKGGRGIFSNLIKSTLLYYLAVAILGCDSQPNEDENTLPEEQKPSTLFQLLDSTATGIGFINQVEDQKDFNILTYRNFYNGGGVAIGDVNNDGLADLYFTANLGGNRLYLNRGNFRFEDITAQTGVAGTRAWSTGATMADINGDGWLDIYVSNSGDVAGDNKENELFINSGTLAEEGLPSFTEAAEKYGLNNQGYSTQAAFFDYDADGDLDCYLLNNSFKDPSRIDLYKSMRDKPDELGGDKLYRNDGNTFTDVTLEAGIYSSAIGFGLGTVIGDINNDHYPDIYVSNDFWERDYLYINQGDGTFSEELIDRINFCSISSMGGDMADINNDGHPEIFTTDMLAGDNYRLKAVSAFDPYHLEDMKYRANYHYQIGQNCLHLNNGQGDFQEVGMLAEVAATDWSWGALFFDFENDGRKDIFVSNGIYRDLMYMDFRDFLGDNGIYRKIAAKEEVDYPSLIAQMPSNPLKNFAFSNTANLHFSNQAKALGLAQPSFSNGAAYGDLDNDGDLDLVVNNVNMPAFVYQNGAEQTDNTYLKIKLDGYATNSFGIGTKVTLRSGANLQMLENYTTRGFESSVEPYLIFGTGSLEIVDQLEVIWPDGAQQTLTQVPTNQTLILQYTDAVSSINPNQSSAKPLSAFVEISQDIIRGKAQHQENTYNDFDHEILLWRMLSTDGPRVITGDVNGDAREDFILLGATDNADQLFVQTAGGKFRPMTIPDFQATKVLESSCGALFDHDGDGDLDLILGAGGNEYQRGSQQFALRYFENTGQGRFTLDESQVPPIVGNFSTVEAQDFDADGDTDLFLGGRCIPGNYGLTPRSFLLVNDRGVWQDATPESLAGIGMVTDATWADIDGDQDQDLVVVGDWMGVHIFRNNGGQLADNQTLPNSRGWWTRVEAADLDQDGDTDFVLGNWGLNSKLKASPQEPLTMFVNDFDQNNKSEFVLNWYPPQDNQSYPFATKMELTKQLPNLRKQILKHEDYASQTYESLFPPATRDASIAYQAEYLESAILWNDSTQLSLQSLPVEAQVAPVFAIAVHDWNNDGHADIWLGGNFYALKPQVGRHDASRGVFLTGSSRRRFRTVSAAMSGIRVEGEVRDAVILPVNQTPTMLVTRNNDEVLMYRRR
ncbi:MAG: VCBS repeat-containing protein [Bacteroidota bacterium]